ncbi:MAG: hypothetical protein WBF58_19635 [Xanthobacteraceae bacterium]
MHRIGRVATVALTLLTLAPALAEAPARARHRVVHPVCLDQRQRRIANESGKIIRLAAAMRAARKRMRGTVVRARLCRGPADLVYVLTVLAHNGKVARLTVDAVKGTVVGQR